MNAAKRLISKYLANECTEEERKEALKLINDPKNDHLLEELADENWHDSAIPVASSPLDPEATYANIANTIKHDSSHKERKQTRFPYQWLYAACFAVLACVASIYIYQSVNSPSEFVVKTIPPGQKSTFILSDGSRINVNSASTIRYPQTFSDSARIIYLEGEAFFEVAKDKARPFSVIANGIKTTALGTSFNIHAYEGQCKIALSTGKLMITTEEQSASHPVILYPGEALDVTQADLLPKKYKFNPDDEILWKDNILHFNNESFESITKTLERWYNVKFEAGDWSNINKRYTGRFENASLTHVLDNMSYTLNFEYILQGRKVTIVSVGSI